jgi:ATP diphosphatase
MKPLTRLIDIMAQLRSPDGGCPWDCAQTFETIAPYTLEEAYEVDDAIRREDMGDLQGELGDLLFQVVFHSRMAQELGLFDFDAVAEGICEKLERRHPHVFGDTQHSSAEALHEAWEREKAQERSQRAAARGGEPAGAFDGIPAAMPALSRTDKLLKRAARLRDAEAPESRECVQRSAAALAKVSELGEEAAAHSLGALLFEAVRLARSLGVDPESALRSANSEFEGRASDRR